MPVVKGLAIDELTRRGNIRDLDVARFRRALYEDSTITRDEAEALIEVNAACAVQDAAWSNLFVEAISDFLVNVEPPEGYVTAENAAWLVERIARDGRIVRKPELDLLVAVIDKARWVPESLCVLALEQVRLAVVGGDGPLRSSGAAGPGQILPGDVALLRRVLFAFSGMGGIAVTQREADVLFAIEDSLTADGNDPSWTDLFVKAIVNALMAAGGCKVPSREEALRADKWQDQRGELTPAAVLKGMASASLRAVWGLYREQSREERAIEQLERRRIEIITAEAITPVEMDWLSSRLGRDGRLSANEAALIDLLKSEGPKNAPALQEVMGRLSKVA